MALLFFTPTVYLPECESLIRTDECVNEIMIDGRSGGQ